jgi:hypothetical protein
LSDNPSAQRHWRALCPQCGAPVEFRSAASSSAVCSFCRSSLLREGDALRRIGQSAELFEDHSPLQLGAAGRFKGEAFTLIGRLQWRAEQGSWNEWHALFDNGRSGWLAEDNGAYVLAFDAPMPQAPQAASLALGSRVPWGGQTWTVASVVVAQVAAAQGELPQPPRPGTAFSVVELRNDKGEVASLAQADQGAAGGPVAGTWSVGTAVALADLSLTGLRGESDAQLGAQSLPCPQCGAALEPTLATTRSITCGQCHAVVDISQGAGADLAHYAQQNGSEPLIALGTVGQLVVEPGKPQAWQVVGYQERCDLPAPGDDDEQTFWREYLLYRREAGFAFLVDTEEGWSLVRPLTGTPQGAGDKVQWQGQAYKQRWQYGAKVTYALGEFYWPVKQGQTAQVTDYDSIGGNQLLSREQTDGEITWSGGRKLQADEVMKAFGLDKSKAGAVARDVSPVSGGQVGGLHWMLWVIVLVVVIIILMSRCESDRCAKVRDNYGSESVEYQQCRQTSGSGSSGGSHGGSYGGFSSGGGGHK